MTHAPPADVAAFITRIRQLEGSGVRPRVFDQFLNIFLVDYGVMLLFDHAVMFQWFLVGLVSL